MNSGKGTRVETAAIESGDGVSSPPLGAADFASRFAQALWDRIASFAALLPILGAYVLISVLIHPSTSDEGSYLAYAHNLTHGFYAETHSLNAAAYLWHGPALPALLAPLVGLHAPVQSMRVIVGPIFLFATLVTFYRLVGLYLRERTALIATYGLALYLPFFAVMGAIWVEPLATLCFTLVVFFMIRSFRGGRYDHLWAAVALAVLALSRVEFGYVLLAALLISLVWLIASRRSLMARRSVVATVVALILCAPWLGYTYSLTGKPFYWGNSGGLSLYWMTAPGNLGDWHQEAEAFTIPQLAADRPVFRQVDRVSPLDQDAKLQHIAFQNIQNDPKHYFSNVVNNLGRLMFNSPYSFTNEKASAMFYAVPNALLLGILSIALLVGIRERRRLELEILPIAGLVFLGFAVHVPVAAYARFVIPLVPAAVWLATVVLGRHLRFASESA